MVAYGIKAAKFVKINCIFARDTIQYCVFNMQEKLACSQLSLPHGTNRKIIEKNELKIN